MLKSVRSRASAGAGALLVILLALAIEEALAPAPGDSVAAMTALGPIDGWRCVHQAVVEYDPRWPRLSGGLLAEPPEAVLSGVRVQRIELDLHTGDAVAWTETVDDKQRVYELRPGDLQTVAQRCVGHLAAWHVISEHSLD